LVLVSAVFPHKLTNYGAESLEMVVAHFRCLREIGLNISYSTITNTGTSNLVPISAIKHIRQYEATRSYSQWPWLNGRGKK
jgi:hypothetical protein